MKNLFQKIKSFYLEKTKKEETYERRGIKPVKDWVAVLELNFIVFCLIVIFALYCYIQIRQDKLFIKAEDNSLEEVKINIGLLEKTVNDINSRRGLNDDARRNGTDFSDPFL